MYSGVWKQPDMPDIVRYLKEMSSFQQFEWDDCPLKFIFLHVTTRMHTFVVATRLVTYVEIFARSEETCFFYF